MSEVRLQGETQLLELPAVTTSYQDSPLVAILLDVQSCFHVQGYLGLENAPP